MHWKENQRRKLEGERVKVREGAMGVKVGRKVLN